MWMGRAIRLCDDSRARSRFAVTQCSRSRGGSDRQGAENQNQAADHGKNGERDAALP
jgi:hypothetical protein